MPVASAARDLTSLPDDSGLRTALRNVPLLPAPANVDDLLARLDADEVPVSSGPLAELISDARYVEPAAAAGHAGEGDGFFAPVSLAANANRRPPLARRVAGGLFNAALLTGVLLILWNALLGPNGAPSPTVPAENAEAVVGTDRAAPAAATVAADDSAPAPREDSALAPSPPAPPSEALEPSQPLAAGEAVALAEPELAPVPDTPELAVEAEAPPASAALGPAELAVQTSAAPAPKLDAELTQPQGTIVSTEPGEPSAPLQAEPLRDVAAQPGSADVASEPTGPAKAEPVREAAAAPRDGNVAGAEAAEPSVLPIPEPLRAAEAVPLSEAAVAEAAVSPAPKAADPIITSEAVLLSEAAAAEAAEASALTAAEPVIMAEAAPTSEAVATAEPAALTMPEPTVAADAPALPEAIGRTDQEAISAATEAELIGALPPPRPASLESYRARAETIVAEPAPPVRPALRERVPFAGIWAASPEACTPAMQEDGHLLARIGARGGRAGDTSCGFKTMRRKANAWQIQAACSDGETSWRSDVRLSLTRGRLTWASQKGSTTYARCPRA